MNNARFSTAVHILTLLASKPGEWMSSEWMAGSININAVMVRKELAVLQQAGLIVSRKGKEGGSMLNKPANEINMADIYNAVKQSEVLGKKHHHTNPKCRIGKSINKKLNELFVETDAIVSDFLEYKTLESFYQQFR